MGLKNGRYDVKGWRRVRIGGRVKFDNYWYQHPRLLPFVGDLVWCENGDIWSGTPIGIFATQFDHFICYAEIEKESECLI